MQTAETVDRLRILKVCGKLFSPLDLERFALENVTTLFNPYLSSRPSPQLEDPDTALLVLYISVSLSVFRMSL